MKGSREPVQRLNVEIAVLLGRSILPMQPLLRMGRGAVICSTPRGFSFQVIPPETSRL